MKRSDWKRVESLRRAGRAEGDDLAFLIACLESESARADALRDRLEDSDDDVFADAPPSILDTWERPI